MHDAILSKCPEYAIGAYLKISVYEIIFGLLGFAATIILILLAERYLQRRRKKQMKKQTDKG